MNLRIGRSLLLAGSLACVALLGIGRAEDKVATTVQPEPRTDKGWLDRNASFNERVKQGNVDLLLIGDSITHGWEGEGKDVWANYYTKRNAVNLGIGGDRTQHVLWRLDHGNIDGIAPKLAIMMIGTNNSNGTDNTAEEIAAGIEAIVKKLRAKLPQTKVLILAIFPRGEKPNPQREKNAKASQIAAKLADNQVVYFLDIGDKFLAADGTLTKEIMPDFLHLSPPGYEIWASSIEPTVTQLMGQK
jgi:lysophospholipase L1-like esterase